MPEHDEELVIGREAVFQCPLCDTARWIRSYGRPLPASPIDRGEHLKIPNIQIEHDGEYVHKATRFARQTAGSHVTVQLSDEKYSIPTRPPVCTYNEATCANGQCIPKSKVCDDHNDCSDGSDELRCSKHNRCEPNEFKCNNGKCVLKTWRCDSENDCIDNSDESDCGTSSPESQCRVDEHQCTSGQCIPKSYVCNAHFDCSDVSDQLGCLEPTVTKPPPPLVKLNPGDTFNITCRAVGFPVPLITWRLNWGHIPDKCKTSSYNGFGVLTCTNIEVKDSGAYSCEAINFKGSLIAVPDSILIVNDGQVCPSGLFNVQANTVEECIQCFCFGVASQCKSADLFIYELPPPVRSLNLAGVTFDPEISIGEFSKSDLIPTQHGIQLRYANLPVTGEQPYFALPSDYSGNQLKSYGGSLRYEVLYVGRGDDINTPDIIISGNKQILTYKNRTRILPNQRNRMVVPLSPDAEWRTIEGRTATRQQIMMTLANVDNILIKLQYVNAVQREIELLHIAMNSAGTTDMGLGSAHLVEECNCPEGHIGLSCESCAPGYVRQNVGAWLGRCVPERRECSDDGTDEESCPPPFTKICEGYICTDGECLQESQQCDGRRDCRDGGDEENCPVDQCREDEFTCQNGDCIRGSDVCNGRPDCYDNSDEENCPPPPPPPPTEPARCSQSEWQCSDGQCISYSDRCNGYPECNDQSDEQGCPQTDPACPPNMFRCENDPCIPLSLRCNGFVDCPYDTSDELDCQEPRPPPSGGQSGEGKPGRLNLKTYPNEQIIKERREVVFQCRDEGPLRAKVRWTRSRGRPLPAGSIDRGGRLEIPNIQLEHDGEYVCEAIEYAPQTPGSQVSVQLTVEKYSIPTRPPVCTYNEATCANGQCIPKSKVCDDHNDCSDGSDELRCSKHNRCEPNEFKCNNGKCVLKTWRCDGENDCIDNSDESDCGTSSPESQCRVDQQQCTSGPCIPKSYVCDAHNDCSDNSDELGCLEPTVTKPPPPLVKLNLGDTFNITCRAGGFPVPLITWRLNWGHIPDKCKTSSHNGFGVLTCTNIEVKDSGAYSCEAINSKGSLIAVPDSILIVNDGQVCPSGLFNVQANTVEECIQCFCFVVASQCKSADLFIYELPPPVRSLNLAGVTFDPEISIGEFSKSDLIPTQHGIQLRYANLPVTGEQPYFALPSDYSGNQLKSYGGSLRYEVIYVGRGDDINTPDIIISGNKQILTYKNRTRILPNQRNRMVVPLSPDAGWRTIEGRTATRQQIMMTLANVDNILIKLQYVNAVQREIELLHIAMDSAGTTDMGLGSAHLVEECNCPEGHIGLSCESCAPGYVRQNVGAWLGRCVPERRECSEGTYGDVSRGIDCRPCPCPVNTQFTASCHLGADNDVVCSCPTGYIGKRCESCERGYEGNPVRGIPCKPVAPTTCNPYGTEEPYVDGRCKCKNNVIGDKCDKCAPNTFALNSRSPTVCMNCFCMGVSRQCTSSSYYRESVFLSYANPRAQPLAVISSYEQQAPDVIETSRISVGSNELSVRGFNPSENVPYYWSLSSAFLGNKITAYGGNLTYTVRYTSLPGGYMSRNNAPDVVIKGQNDIELVHYRDDTQSSSGFQTVTIPMVEDLWQRLDGKDVSRPHFLMALADVEAIYIKATYTTITEDAALQDVSLDVASARNTGSGAQAIEVEDCTCPEGHIGLSCEDCARGYTRSADAVIYLGSCEPCVCNGHSQDCHPENGVCENCRHNTRGEGCEQCDYGYVGNATIGTPYDCKLDTLTECIQSCNFKGGYCVNDEYICKPNVQGTRCGECREGTFNLDQSNPNGCTECYSSGATRTCTTANLYREEIPMIIFEDKFKLTNYDNSEKLDNDIKVAEFNNEVSYQFENYEKSQKWYWNLPSRFLGNQVLSYGGNLTITQKTQGYSPSSDVQNVILKGRGVTLVWENNNFVDDTYSVVLYEQYWRNYQRSGVHTVNRADLLNVLSNLDSILVLASKYDETEAAYISDIILDTAVSHQTNKQKTVNIEECYCPRGYHGKSCESCDNLYYRDLTGACHSCPCHESNTESCSLSSENRVRCICRSGYYGSECRDTEPDIGPPEPPHKPNITVKISQPTLKIFEVGETARVTCSGEHIHQIPVRVHWFKLDGQFSIRVYVEQGTLLIRNLQEDDSGVYECRAASETETVGAQVTITVAVPQLPIVTFVPQYVDEEEYASPEVECQVSGSPKPSITWERLDGDMPRNAEIRENVLRFNSIRKSDEGEYRCFAQNTLGSDDQILRVYVRTSAEPTEPPHHQVIVIEPETVQTKPGEEFTLTCGNNPSQSVVWSKAGANTLPENTYVNRNVLRVFNTQLFDAGTYICRINVNGRTEEAYATVIIATSSIYPEIKRLPESAQIIQGSDYTLICDASGTPNPVIKWTMHHEIFNAYVQQVGNTLHIYNAQVTNGGTYSCVATNDAGTDESSIRIEIVAPEQPVIEIHPNENGTILTMMI